MTFEEIITYLISLPNFQEIGLWLVFLLSAIPLVSALPEALMVSLIQLETGDVALLQSNLLMISTGGSIISHIIVYYIVREHAHRLYKYFGISKQKDMRKDHIFHKYGVAVFLVTPMVIFLPLTDIFTVFVAHYRLSFTRYFIFMTIGEILRGLAIAYGVVSLI